MKKYRVRYFESERGYGNDSWDKDFETKEDALKDVERIEARYGGRDVVPDYYVTAFCVGEFE